MDFVTIYSASTQNMDYALFVMDSVDGSRQLTIAIVDSTAYVEQGNVLDYITRGRAFTNYLPSFNIISILPRNLYDNLYLLHLNKCCQVLTCRITIGTDGILGNEIQFSTAKIESKGKLIYDETSN